MLSEDQLASALASLALIEVDRAVTRFIPAAFARTALKAVGALRTGGRFNPPGTPALYTSIRRSTALAEATHLVDDDIPIIPLLMLSVVVHSSNIADLTGAAVLRACATAYAELTAPIIEMAAGTAPTQLLGRLAHSTQRIEGLIVWSRVASDEKNLVLSPDRLGMSYGLNDPKHDLPTIHPAVRATVDILMEIDGP